MFPWLSDKNGGRWVKYRKMRVSPLSQASVTVMVGVTVGVCTLKHGESAGTLRPHIWQYTDGFSRSLFWNLVMPLLLQSRQLNCCPGLQTLSEIPVVIRQCSVNSRTNWFFKMKMEISVNVRVTAVFYQNKNPN